MRRLLDVFKQNASLLANKGHTNAKCGISLSQCRHKTNQTHLSVNKNKKFTFHCKRLTISIDYLTRRLKSIENWENSKFHKLLLLEWHLKYRKVDSCEMRHKMKRMSSHKFIESDWYRHWRRILVLLPKRSNLWKYSNINNSTRK